MNVKFLLIFLLLILLLISGCGVYGQGTATGYIVAVDDSIFWDSVWIKTDLASSNEDCYIIRDSNNDLGKSLQEAAFEKQRVRIKYSRHLIILKIEDCLDDEIVGVNKL